MAKIVRDIPVWQTDINKMEGGYVYVIRLKKEPREFRIGELIARSATSVTFRHDDRNGYTHIGDIGAYMRLTPDEFADDCTD